MPMMMVFRAVMTRPGELTKPARPAEQKPAAGTR
jgi:hypothetical protein